MQGLLILVFSKLDHVPFIRDIQSTFTRTGILGYWVSSSTEGTLPLLVLLLPSLPSG